MTDHPIIFSAPMVRAILDGRKTMTRRIIKPQPTECRSTAAISGQSVTTWEWTGKPNIRRPGDRLWVREGFALVGTTDPGFLLYRANGYEAECNRHGFDRPYPPETKVHWRSSAVMPRWASRITLLVTDVRVERVRDIRDADAEQEGVEAILVPPDGGSVPHIQGFIRLWTHLHGPDAWERNDWVSVTKFERIGG